MNLEKMNLVELNAQEVKEVGGGFLGLLIFAAICILAYCWASDGLERTKVFVDGVQVGE